MDVWLSQQIRQSVSWRRTVFPFLWICQYFYGCSGGLDTISENLKLKFGTCVQVLPPSMELNDCPKIGASLGRPSPEPDPSRPMSGGVPLTPRNRLVLGICSTMKRFWIRPLSIPL